MAPNYRLKTFLSGNADDHENSNQPIADLFANCTVLFAGECAYPRLPLPRCRLPDDSSQVYFPYSPFLRHLDIAGFTAWSSTREPAQVFLLLQAVYQAFDNLAKRRRVFKVETIGDSYGEHPL